MYTNNIHRCRSHVRNATGMMQGKGQAGNVSTDEKHETQSSGAGSKGETHMSTFNFFFTPSFFCFNYTCTKQYDTFATKDQTDGNPSAESGAPLWGSHWFKSAFPKPWDSLAPCQHRNFLEKSKAGYSKWTGTHKEGTAVRVWKFSFPTCNIKLGMSKSTVFMAMLDPVCHFCCGWEGFQKIKCILTSSHF